MFLIEFRKGEFINAELIGRIYIGRENIVFHMSGDTKKCLNVDKEFTDMFLNHLQALNSNIAMSLSGRGRV